MGLFLFFQPWLFCFFEFGFENVGVGLYGGAIIPATCMSPGAFFAARGAFRARRAYLRAVSSGQRWADTAATSSLYDGSRRL